MTIAVTGATGQLGRLVVEKLLDRGIVPGEIVATGRNVSALDDLAARGVDVRRADFEEPDSMRAAFENVDRLLLVSTTTVGERLGNHQRAIDAAAASDVGKIVYTSAINASWASMTLAAEHRATEEYLASIGIAHTVLRNGWYLENYTDQLPAILASGSVQGAAGAGKVNAAARDDYAEAAVVVLMQDHHDGATYELGGDQSFTLEELAQQITALSGKQVRYTPVTEPESAAMLESFGLPAPLAAVLANADAGLERGELWTDSDDLSLLIGRPTTKLEDALRVALI